jgi:hypothetical protein
VAVWTFRFEVRKLLEGNQHLDVSVEADNWTDASSKAGYEFIQKYPEHMGDDYISIIGNRVP